MQSPFLCTARHAKAERRSHFSTAEKTRFHEEPVASLKHANHEVNSKKLFGLQRHSISMVYKA